MTWKGRHPRLEFQLVLPSVWASCSGNTIASRIIDGFGGCRHHVATTRPASLIVACRRAEASDCNAETVESAFAEAYDFQEVQKVRLLKFAGKGSLSGPVAACQPHGNSGRFEGTDLQLGQFVHEPT